MSIFTVTVSNKNYWCELVVRADSQESAIKKFENFNSRLMYYIGKQEWEAQPFRGDETERELLDAMDEYIYCLDPFDVEQDDDFEGEASELVRIVQSGCNG